MGTAGIEKQGAPEHRSTYNGKEKQEGFGLGWYSLNFPLDTFLSGKVSIFTDMLL